MKKFYKDLKYSILFNIVNKIKKYSLINKE